jgi:uncharacterized protein YprB with RNaseH-like and TPR domain
MECRAYLDIETTGLSPSGSELTVIGVFREDSGEDAVIQFIGDEISPAKLLYAVKDITVLYTYNGKRFDLPFIRTKLDVDLTEHCAHEDLMYACWKNNLKGGLKSVERQLGIERKLPDVDGWMAVQLWNKYEVYGDENALNILLRYNEEDVLNLKVLREMLGMQ